MFRDSNIVSFSQFLKFISLFRHCEQIAPPDGLPFHFLTGTLQVCKTMGTTEKKENLKMSNRTYKHPYFRHHVGL